MIHIEKRALKTFLYNRSARQRCMNVSVPIGGHGHNYMIYVHASRLSIYILTSTLRVRNIFTINFFATRAKIWIAHISAGPFFFLMVFFGSNNSLFYVRASPSDAHAKNISAAPPTLTSRVGTWKELCRSQSLANIFVNVLQSKTHLWKSIVDAYLVTDSKLIRRLFRHDECDNWRNPIWDNLRT